MATGAVSGLHSEVVRESARLGAALEAFRTRWSLHGNAPRVSHGSDGDIAYAVVNNVLLAIGVLDTLALQPHAANSDGLLRAAIASAANMHDCLIDYEPNSKGIDTNSQSSDADIQVQLDPRPVVATEVQAALNRRLLIVGRDFSKMAGPTHLMTKPVARG